MSQITKDYSRISLDDVFIEYPEFVETTYEGCSTFWNAQIPQATINVEGIHIMFECGSHER